MGLLGDIAGNTKWTQMPQVTTLDPVTHVITSDSQRYGIGFSNSDVSPITLTLLSNNTGGGGIVLAVGEFKWMTVKDYGSIVQSDWYINNNGLVQPFVVFTLVFPKE